jgi:Helix-turn-helix domain
MKTLQPKHTNKSQSNRILAHLKSGKSITPMEALVKFSCFRLAARVHELKAQGHKIKQTTKNNRKTNKKFASYSL